jgi:ATP synthase F1 gamma subunit
MQLNELRKELEFTTDLLSLVETLKNVAGSKYHVLERQKERFDQFMEAFVGFFRVVDLVDVVNPLATIASDKLGIVVVTSDSGFMGGLNQGVLRAAAVAQGDLRDDQVELVMIGDKGAGTMSDREREFKFFQGIDETTMYEQAVEIKDYIVEEVLAKRMGKVVVVYARPLSFTAQEIDAIDLLPCGELFDKEAKTEITERTKGQKAMDDASKVIVESSFVDMVSYLAGVWVTQKLFEVFEDSKLSEFSARAMHLEGSFQKVEETQKKVKHQCFKASHEAIDKGMRECFAAKMTKERKDEKKKKLAKQRKAEAAAKEAAKDQAAA